MKRLSLVLPKFFVIIAATFTALALASSAQANNYVVSTAADLQAAIDDAAASPGPDTIHLTATVFHVGNEISTVILYGPDSITLSGAGASSTILDGDARPNTVVEVSGERQMTIEGVTIQNSAGSGVRVSGNDLLLRTSVVQNNGEDGIYDNGAVTVRDSVVRDNDFAGIESVNQGLAIFGSTISGNGTPGETNDWYGGIYVESPFSAVNSTITGNHVRGILVSCACGGASLTNVTIDGNDGFGLATFDAINVVNTIIADNTSGDCKLPSDAVSLGHNLIGDGTCGFGAPGDLNGVSPQLGPLQDNGGPTPTMVPAATSPAVDAGDNVPCPATDQRGVNRPKNFVCDIGAVERTPFDFEKAVGLVGPGGSVTTDTEGDGATLDDPIETTVTHPDGGFISIREGPDAAAEFFIGQRVQLDVTPDATPANPLVIVFLIDSSVIPLGQSAATIEVLKNGLPVPPCTGAPQAVPDPCVSSRQTVGDDAEITVLTSDASNWDFAPGAGPPPPMPELSIGDATVTEPDAGAILAQFTVTRTGDTSGFSSVDFQTADGAATSPDDYASTSGSLFFAPGDTEETVFVQVNGDTLDEADESFFVVLSSPIGASIVDGQGEGTIIDNDTATISIGDNAVIEDDSGMTPAEFRVTLSSPSASTVTVDFNTADGTAMAPGDYLPNAGPLVFMPGETVKAVTVQVNGDTIVEPDESFFVNLSNAVGASIADGQGEGTILDDDLSADFNARVDGKGSIGPGHDLRKFKVKARFTNGLPRGKATYVDKLASPAWKFQSTAFTRLTCVGTLATIEGAGRVNGSPVSFVIRARDLGKKGMGDMFSIEWSGSSSYGASGPLTRGDIKIKDC